MEFPVVETERLGIRRLHMDMRRGWDHIVAILNLMITELTEGLDEVNGKPELPRTTGVTKGEKFFQLLITNFQGLCLEFRFVRRTLYLVGVRIPKGMWVNLCPTKTYFDSKDGTINNFSFGSLEYRDLVLAEKLSEIQLKIGLAPLDASISFLHNVLLNGPGDQIMWNAMEHIGKSLVVVIFMTSEICRFREIHSFILGKMFPYDICEVDLPWWMAELVRQWEALSDIWRLVNENEQLATEKLLEMGLILANDRPLHTLEGLAAVIGVLKAAAADEHIPSGSSTSGGRRGSKPRDDENKGKRTSGLPKLWGRRGKA